MLKLTSSTAFTNSCAAEQPVFHGKMDFQIFNFEQRVHSDAKAFKMKLRRSQSL